GHTLSTAASDVVILADGEVYLDADFGFAPPPDEPVIDLEVTKTVSPASVTVGDSATFSISVTNQGPDPATGVVMTDTLPAGVTFVSSTAGTEAGGVITVPVGDLAVGSEFVFSVTVTVDESGAFTNAAEVTAADQDDVDSTPGDGQGDDHDTAAVEATQVLANNSIGDFVWLDIDGDGAQDSGEPGIAGAVVNLTGSTTLSTTTASDGKYLFSALDDGTYTISINTSSVDDDYSLTTSASFTITVSGGVTNLTADFGFNEVLPKTGAETRPIAVLGFALILFGAVLLTVSRRRAELV
ncbi:MAG: DUF11 domain-containing protein, partial [Acidimicrobiia bacterium]|nr:DUF11 domain-containing protein [Acidimicrobiia bacterium]